MDHRLAELRAKLSTNGLHRRIVPDAWYIIVQELIVDKNLFKTGSSGDLENSDAIYFSSNLVKWITLVVKHLSIESTLFTAWEFKT